MIMSNMTVKEHLKIHGSLPLSEIEALVDRLEVIESRDLSGVEAHISEAKAQFPDEDFLSPALKRISELIKRMRGDNRQELFFIHQQLEQIQDQQVNATLYAFQEIKSAINLVSTEGLK